MFKLDVDEACVGKVNQVVDLDVGTQKPVSVPKEPQMKWHKRLGHLNHKSMNNMKKLVLGMNYDTEEYQVCEPCIMGKMSRKSFPKSQDGFQRSKGLLELVHSDVCSFEVPSVGGARYFVSFIDDYSRKVCVYLMKNKNEVFDHFLQATGRKADRKTNQESQDRQRWGVRKFKIQELPASQWNTAPQDRPLHTTAKLSKPSG